jgi:hypothetical protein
LKKLFAAMLLAIYLFNIGGQLVLHQYFSYKAEKFFIEQVNKGFYNINDLTEVKIPVNLPGITDWKVYENIKGQIQFQNNSYNYVKMKITRTAMYLLCVPDYSTTHLSDQNILGAKQCKDNPIPKKEHVPFGKTPMLGQFSFAFNQFVFIVPVKAIEINIVEPVQQVLDHFLKIPEQPPKFAC